MNLADAIRQAAYGGTFDPEVPAPAPAPAVVRQQPKAKTPKVKEKFVEQQADDPISGHPTMMRMELFLSPEQMAALFKAVVSTQHSVMTLREAAGYLRINPSTLEQMAQHGEVAGFMVNNHWRFPKSGLDEWVALNTFRKEDADAA